MTGVDTLLDTKETFVVGVDAPEQGKADGLRKELYGFLDVLFEPHEDNGNSVPLSPWEKEQKLKAYVQWVDDKAEKKFACDPDDLKPGITTTKHGKSGYRISHNINGVSGEGKEEKEASGDFEKGLRKHLLLLKNFFTKVPDPHIELSGMVKTIVDLRYTQYEKMNEFDVSV